MPTIHRDIPFLGPDRAEAMDAYLPDEAFTRPLPAVLWIHGGGWKSGDKAQAREVNIGTNLVAAGYAVFSINYLLNTAERVAWPRNFLDCADALTWLKTEGLRFGIDPGRIAVMGGSAGGHLALLLGASAGVDALHRGTARPDVDRTVRCIGDFYGVSEITGHRRAIFAGATEAETEANVRLASPLTWIDGGTPPILIAHGTADRIVPVDFSRRLAAVLAERGVEHEYIEIPDAPHTFHLQPEQRDLRPAVLAFLGKHLGQPERRGQTSS